MMLAGCVQVLLLTYFAIYLSGLTRVNPDDTFSHDGLTRNYINVITIIIIIVAHAQNRIALRFGRTQE